MKTYQWVVSRVAEFGSPDRATVLAREFVRQHGGLWYRQYADAHGSPEKGAGILFDPKKFVIGQNACRGRLEALGLK